LYSAACNDTGDAAGNSDCFNTVGRNTESADKFGTRLASVDNDDTAINEAALINGPLINCTCPSMSLHQHPQQTQLDTIQFMMMHFNNKLHYALRILQGF